MRRLGRGVDHDLVEPVIARGQHGAAFQGRPRLPVHPVLAFDDDLRGLCRAVDIAGFDAPFEVEIVAPILVHQGAAATQRGRRIDDGIERLEIDGDARGEVLRQGAARRDAGGDRLADIAHLVGRQRRPRRRLGAAGLRHHPDRRHPRQIGRGEDMAARCMRHRDPADPGMGMRAAQEGHLLRAGQPYVRHELAAPAQVPVILPAQQRGTDAVAGLFGLHRCALQVSPRRHGEHREKENASRRSPYLRGEFS